MDLIEKISMLFITLLLGVLLLTGCSKSEEPTGGAEPGTTVTATPMPTATPIPTATPTPEPTPTPVFVKTAYETVGSDNMYRVPLAELEGEFSYYMANKFAGDYVLLWIDTPVKLDEPEPVEGSDYFIEYKDKNVLVLMQPTVNTEQYRFEFDYMINELYLLDDGTVVFEEMESNTVHVLNSELEEIITFNPDENYSATLGVDTEGYIWFADKENNKLISTNLKGEKRAEYDYDPEYLATKYLGDYNGQKCFVIVEKEDYIAHKYLYLSENGELNYVTDDCTQLGYEWKGYSIASSDILDITSSRSTWFFHAPGYIEEGYAFPKSSMNEGISFHQGNILCGGGEFCVDREKYKYRHEYRIYNLEKGTVSDMLREEDIPECSYMYMLGTIGDDYVLISSFKEDESRELLLWDISENTSPIPGFCDFKKDDPAECVAELIKDAKDNYNIEITPDRTAYDGTTLALGKLMEEMEFANAFILTAKENPEVVKPKNNDTLRPENKNNNDGANYTFNPHVFSGFYLKEHGEERRDAFFRYVDALREGADGFECKNEGEAAWSSGRLATYFFPVGGAYASAEYTGDGWATINYSIPKEEFLEKEKEFEEQIVAILNDVLEEDYTDFEKALALYEFMTEYTVYDYEMLDHLTEWMERQSGYRVLTEQKGICWEISCLYRYLLLQCGVDAEESSGIPVNPEEDTHQWNYLELDGVGYLIDATWGLTQNREPNLEYFLFTDQMREDRDGFKSESFDIGGYGLYGARKKYSFEAKDERYSELWFGTYIAFDEEEKCVFYRNIFGEICRFDYANL